MAYDDIKDKGFDNRTTAEQQKSASLGGQASGKTRALKSIANKYGSLKAPAEVIARLIEDNMIQAGTDVSFDEAMIMAQYMKSFEGDTKAARYISEIKGEMVQKIEARQNVDASLERLNGILDRRKSDNAD